MIGVVVDGQLNLGQVLPSLTPTKNTSPQHLLDSRTTLDIENQEDFERPRLPARMSAQVVDGLQKVTCKLTLLVAHLVSTQEPQLNPGSK